MLLKLLERAPDHREVAAVLTLKSPGPLGERIRARGIRLFSLQMERKLQLPLAALRIARIANAFAPDIVHGWMHMGSIAASMAAATMTRPVSLVWNIRHSLHDDMVHAPRKMRGLKLGGWMSGHPDSIVFNSRAAMRQHARVGYNVERGLLVPNGFDTALYRPGTDARTLLCASFGIDPGAIVVGHIGRRHPMKGHAMLVEAVARARAKGIDLHLLLAGSGLDAPDRELRHFAAAMLPANRVTFSGVRSDVPAWLPGLDMLAMSSAWGEGFSNVIGEALACGVPVVATDVGDSADIVGPGGLIVPPGDAEGFSEAMSSMAMMDPEQRHLLGLAGRQRVIDNYSLDAVVDLYRSLHYQLCDDSRYLGRPTRERGPSPSGADG